MTANPVPTLVLPDPQGQSRPQDNNNAIIRYTKTISPRMYASDAPLFTDAPNPPTPPSDSYLLIAGTQAVVFTGGAGILTLPQPAPNGILSWQGTVDYLDGNYWVQYISSELDLSLMELATGPTAATGTLHISYTAIVW